MSIEKTLEMFCDPSLVAETGKFIDRKEAIIRFDAREGAELFKKDIAGFHFDLEILKTFFNQIETYNSSHDDKITGIRIWQARSYAFFGNDDEYGQLAEDVVITPTLTDGSDIHATSAGDTLRIPATGGVLTDLILSSSRPCPNLCGSPGIKFFHQNRT